MEPTPFSDGRSFVKWLTNAYPHITLFKKGSIKGHTWFGGNNGQLQINIYEKYVTFEAFSGGKMSYETPKRITGYCKKLWGDPIE